MSEATDVEGRLAGRRAWVLGLGIVALEFAAAVAVMVSATLLPVIAADLDAGEQLAVLVSGSEIGLFTALALAPQVLRRLGGRATLAGGLVLSVTGAAWSAAAADAWSFAGGRAVAGFAGGLLAVFGVSSAIEHLTDRIRMRVIAASTAMWIVPGLVGPTATVAVEHLVGWRWALLAPVPIALVGRALVLRAGVGLVPSAGHRPAVRSLLVPVGVAGFVVLTEVGWWIPAVAGLVVATVGFAALMPPGTTRLRPGAPAALAALTLFGFGYFGATSLITIAFTSGLGASLTQAGWALGAAPVAWAAVTLTIPRLGDRGRAPGPALGLALTTAGVLATAVLVSQRSAYLPALVVWVLVGAGVGAAYPTMYLRATTPDATTGATALATAVITTESFGALIGSTAGGAAVSAATAHGLPPSTGLGLTYTGFALVLAAATIAAARSRPPTGHDTNPPAPSRRRR